MNIIDVWKQAKVNQTYKRKSQSWLRERGIDDLPQVLKNCSFDDLLAEDWEIIKNKKKTTATIKLIRINNIKENRDANWLVVGEQVGPGYIPENKFINATFEWEE